jgi:DUF917 family protein
MPRQLSYQDMQDLIAGAIVLGCGGGGDPAMAEAMVDEVFAQGKEFILLDPKELQPEDWVCILGHVGGGIEPKEREMIKDLPRVWPVPILVAEEELAKYLEVEFQAYLPSEIGAGNTVTPMYVAAMRGKAVIDGDAAGGRAKPELIISTTHLMGIPVTPLALANNFGDTMILKNSSSDDRVEKICRYLARVSGGRVAAARCPSQGKGILPAVYPRSISMAIRAGQIIREEKEKAIEALIKLFKGSKRFAGQVESFSREEKDGFMWGEIILRGSSEFSGEFYKIWYKNENLISWKGNQLDMTCPDAIIILDARTGNGLYNWGDQFYPGREVTVVGLPAAPFWNDPRAYQIFGPSHFGFDFPPKPMQLGHG